jgi:hypothetical protein
VYLAEEKPECQLKRILFLFLEGAAKLKTNHEEGKSFPRQDLLKLVLQLTRE